VFVSAVFTALASGLDRDLRIPFLAPVRHVAADRAYVSNTVIALFAFAAARPRAAGIVLRLLVHLAFRGVGLFSIRHAEGSGGSVFSPFAHRFWTTAQ
jgi:hypothetical protein